MGFGSLDAVIIDAKYPQKNELPLLFILCIYLGLGDTHSRL